MTAVLVITNEQDLGADLVVLELQRRGVQVLRCNTEVLPRWKITCNPGIAWSMEDRLGRIATSESVRGVWWRRPEPPAPPEAFASIEERGAFTDQWQALIEGLASVSGPRWVSLPASIRAAEDKAAQLSVARHLGFRVPSTVWTNDRRSIGSEGRAVVKPVTTAAWSDDRGPAFVFARLVDAEDFPDEGELSEMPAVFQQPIWPKQDVRVTVVGDRAMAAIATADPDYEIDWRLNPAREWRPYALNPSDVDCCVDLVKSLGLRFGAIDLALDGQGDLWFLEINPNGEWGWLSQLADLPIVSALCDDLTGA